MRGSQEIARFWCAQRHEFVGDTLRDLTGRADQALCRAKEGGRNRVEVALPAYVRFR